MIPNFDMDESLSFEKARGNQPDLIPFTQNQADLYRTISAILADEI